MVTSSLVSVGARHRGTAVWKKRKMTVTMPRWLVLAVARKIGVRYQQRRTHIAERNPSPPRL